MPRVRRSHSHSACSRAFQHLVAGQGNHVHNLFHVHPHSTCNQACFAILCTGQHVLWHAEALHNNMASHVVQVAQHAVALPTFVVQQASHCHLLSASRSSGKPSTVSVLWCGGNVSNARPHSSLPGKNGENSSKCTALLRYQVALSCV